MLASETYIQLFADLGTSWEVSDDQIKQLEHFVSHMYGQATSSVNDARHKSVFNVFCSNSLLEGGGGVMLC